jgi:Peptidase propeptide and YPEB domain
LLVAAPTRGFYLPKAENRRFISPMKFVSLLALSLIVSFSLLQANPRESKSDSKITKNEAEHIALKSHSGARVTAAKLEKVGGKSVWLIEVSGPKADRVCQVSVDAMSGRVISDKKSSR